MKKRFLLIIPITLGIVSLILALYSYFKLENLMGEFSEISPTDVSKEVLIVELVGVTSSSIAFLKGFILVSGLLVLTSAGFLWKCYMPENKA